MEKKPDKKEKNKDALSLEKSASEEMREMREARRGRSASRVDRFDRHLESPERDGSGAHVPVTQEPIDDIEYWDRIESMDKAFTTIMGEWLRQEMEQDAPELRQPGDKESERDNDDHSRDEALDLER